MLFYKKIKAGALQYVLVISVIIAIIIFAFISLLYLQKRIQLKNSFYKETIENVQFGFDYLQKKEVTLNNKQSFQFSDNPLEKTTITTKQWGLFNIATISSKIKNEVFKKTGLLGNNNTKREALYLQENNKPIAVVGKTRIIGNAYLPKQGIKRGNISGTSYNGSQLIYGSSFLSKSTLPEIKNISAIKNIFNNSFLNDSIQFFELEDEMNKINSFEKSTLVYKTNGTLILRNISLTGNIIIQSTKSIKIHSSASLKDVIIIAPEIEILTRVAGNFQAFATKKITVKKNCTLTYPSSLVLIDKNTTNTKENPQIITEGKIDFRGSILYYTASKKMNFSQQIILSEQTTVTGEVYCNKNLELLGKVNGSVYTNHFITKKSGSVYVNHLYNAEINNKKLPEQFCGLPIKSKNLKVVKWLY